MTNRTSALFLSEEAVTHAILCLGQTRAGA